MIHLTKRDLGNFPIINPYPIRHDESEYSLPTICVAPTIAKAIVGLGEWRDYDKVHVYSEVSASPIPAKFVFDFGITQEHRLYKPTPFVKIGEIDLSIISEFLTERITSGLPDEEILSNIEIDYLELKKLFNC